MNEKQSFAVTFFRLYDRKIASGEITFSKVGIKKDDFTKLCTDGTFVFDEETIKRICVTMNLSEEEKKELLESARQ
ncbi:MAG: hypothetical protein RR313_04355 [Anaerovoracaceae bacterium]